MKAKECYGCKNIVALPIGKCNVCGGSNFRVFTTVRLVEPKDDDDIWKKATLAFPDGTILNISLPSDTVDKQPEGFLPRWSEQELPKPRIKTTVIPDGWLHKPADSEVWFCDEQEIDDEITDVTDTDQLLKEIECGAGSET